MITLGRATWIATAMLCLPTVSPAEAVPSRDQSDQAVSATRPSDDAPGAAIDGTLFAVSVARATTSGPPAPRRQGLTPSRRQDTLWNGVLLGAGAGGLLGVLSGELLVECSECAGFNVPLTFGVLGAGLGAGVGAAIDAMRHTRSPTPNRPPGVTVAPILGRKQRAVVAVVRF